MIAPQTQLSMDALLLLAQMRAATARLRCLEFDIEEVALTLKAGRISAAGALAWLRENDVLSLVLRESDAREAA